MGFAESESLRVSRIEECMNELRQRLENVDVTNNDWKVGIHGTLNWFVWTLFTCFLCIMLCSFSLRYWLQQIEGFSSNAHDSFVSTGISNRAGPNNSALVAESEATSHPRFSVGDEEEEEDERRAENGEKHSEWTHNNFFVYRMKVLIVSQPISLYYILIST